MNNGLVTAPFDVSGAGTHYLYPGGFVDGSNIWPSSGFVSKITVAGTGAANTAIDIYDFSLAGDGGLPNGRRLFATPGGTLTPETNNPADIVGSADPGVSGFRRVWGALNTENGDEFEVCAMAPTGIILVVPQIAGGVLTVTWQPLTRGSYRYRAAQTAYEHLSL